MTNIEILATSYLAGKVAPTDIVDRDDASLFAELNAISTLPEMIEFLEFFSDEAIKAICQNAGLMADDRGDINEMMYEQNRRLFSYIR